jgi:hypothetical protein
MVSLVLRFNNVRNVAGFGKLLLRQAFDDCSTSAFKAWVACCRPCRSVWRNPSETLLRAKQERLDNWHTLQELAGII